ncbi:MAG TPA: beta-propeller domain-containing protein, partial [Candidatus Binatia bacterium]|nr:beta-propeller domain-containing protein [Candidatus Binatia bacterium]
VTFFQIDPLWVVDLSDAAAPRIAGSVDVPGWSTFIAPLGQQLVTVGIESNRVAVSLFDVANPAAPALLNRARFGENYSWSEANWDEKAFSVLPEAGLILVPFTGATTNGYASRVQLIDLKATSLVARGVIEHPFQPRRATLYGDRILSLSGWELLSVDATDRDHPLVRGTTMLAWPVDRVILHGNFLLELGGTAGWDWWGNAGNPVLRVAAADSPDQLLGQLELTNLPVLSATQRGSRLYIAQGQQGWFYPPVPLADDGSNATDQSGAQFLLTVVGLDALPAVPVLGQVQTKGVMPGFSGDWQALWPKPEVVVFVGAGFNWWWRRCLECPVPLAVDTISVQPWPFFWGGSGGQLLAFDVSDAASPQFASTVNLGTNTWWSFSQAFTAEGLVYLSHQTSEFLPWVLPASPTPTSPGALDGTVTNVTVTNIAPIGTWVSRSYLDVVDYADPRNPTVRQPVNIPGTLNGISQQGSVLYTIGTHWTTNQATAWTQFLDASAYDGVAAHLIDSLALPTTWPLPVLAVETNLFIGVPDYGNGAGSGVVYGPISPIIPLTASSGANDPATTSVDTPGHRLETWYLSAAGKFTRSGSVALTMPASALANFGALLAAQQTDNIVVLFDAADGAALRQVGQSKPTGCLWFNLGHADGALGRGLWVPLGAYGVEKIPAGP